MLLSVNHEDYRYEQLLEDEDINMLTQIMFYKYLIPPKEIINMIYTNH